MRREIIMLKKIWWQLELLESLHPEFVHRALEPMAPDQDELIDRQLTISAVFPYGQDIASQFLDSVCKNMSDKLGPIFAAMVQGWQVVATALDRDRSIDPIDIDYLKGNADEARLFDPMDFYKLASSPPNAESEKTREIIIKLINSGPYRNFRFGEDGTGRLEELKPRVANFDSVVERIIDAVVLAQLYQRPIRVTPILLVGPPGIGKTYFTDQLSKILSVPLKRIAMDNFQTGSTLAGSAYIWSNTQVGEVFRGLVEGDHISPMIILDEIDKANDTYRHQGTDTLSALHNLLEPGSAKHFQDASFPLSIDASNIIWIATANDVTKIPETLVSRMDVVEIKEPTSEQYRGILDEICRELIEEYPGISLDAEVLEALSDKTPREQRQLLQRAIARAARTGERKITIEHLGKVASPHRAKPAMGLGYRRQNVR